MQSFAETASKSRSPFLFLESWVHVKSSPVFRCDSRLNWTKKFLRRVLVVTDGAAPLVRRDLEKRLNKVRAGLGDQAVDYVLRARNEMVLSSLHALAGKAKLEIAEI